MLRPAQTFCDLPFLAPGDLRGKRIDAAIFGAGHGTPYEPGTPSHSAEAPDAIRASLDPYSTNRAHIDMDHGGPVLGDIRAADLGDVPGDPGDAGAANRAAICEVVRSIRAAGAAPIMLGGDDSVPIPFFQGFEGEPVWIVQMDAHIDWRDEVGGVTHGYSSTMRRASEMAHVQGIVQIGARGVGSARAGELQAAEAWGAKLFPMRRVHRDGLAPAIAAVPEGASVILTMDADGLDPALCPGVLSPTHGGLGYQQMLDLFEGLAARARVVGATMVEYTPARDPQGVGALALARLICSLLAVMRR